MMPGVAASHRCGLGWPWLAWLAMAGHCWRSLAMAGDPLAMAAGPWLALIMAGFFLFAIACGRLLAVACDACDLATLAITSCDRLLATACVACHRFFRLFPPPGVGHELVGPVWVGFWVLVVSGRNPELGGFWALVGFLLSYQ